VHRIYVRQTKYKCLYIIRWAEELALLWVDLPLRARICRFLASSDSDL